jgi:hypothetical protein
LPSKECSDNQIRSLLALAHLERYQYRPGALIDLEGGEIITAPRAVIDLLLGRNPPLPEYSEPEKRPNPDLSDDPKKADCAESQRARVGCSENVGFVDLIKSDPLIADLIADGGTMQPEGVV